MRILVTGANGQLGSEIRAIECDYDDHQFFFYNSTEMDITDSFSVLNAFEKCNPEMVINCAAYTAVDKAEDEPEEAFGVNAFGVKHLVHACLQTGASLIHISTDYVFNGKNHRPYVESDNVDPIGVYGKSKRAGEEAILDSNISGLIIRTSWVYSQYGSNFVKTMLRLGKEHDRLNVIFDQVGTPTNAMDLAQAIMAAIDQKEKWNGNREIFHFSNEGVCSWFDFAFAIFEISGINCKVNPILTKDYPTKADRPHFSVLDKTAFKNRFNLSVPFWKSSLSNSPVFFSL